MVVQCPTCKLHYDDEFRNTDCQHEAFLANDGQNNFKIYEESWLSQFEPGEHYQEWLNKNKVKSNG